MLKSLVFLLCLLLLGCEQQTIFPIKVGDKDVLVEVAADPQSRAYGLMSRDVLDTNSGMLFIYPNQHVLSMWMLNVPIPLDVGFFDSQGDLVSVHTMVVDGGKKTYSSGKPALYALEMRAGWFAENGISAGSRLRLAANVKSISVK